MLDVLRTLFRTSFTNLSFLKRRMMRLAVVGILGGGAAYAFGVQRNATVGGIDWSHLSLTSGVGFIGGFLVGATMRLFLKVALMLGLAFVALGYGLHYLGWIEFPWHSFGDAASDIGRVVERQGESLRTFFSGILPAGVATVLGLGSGVTQKPQFDDDTD